MTFCRENEIANVFIADFVKRIAAFVTPPWKTTARSLPRRKRILVKSGARLCANIDLSLQCTHFCSETPGISLKKLRLDCTYVKTYKSTTTGIRELRAG